MNFVGSPPPTNRGSASFYLSLLPLTTCCPFSVRRYLCWLLLGLSGIVRSIKPSSTNSANIRLKYPERLGILTPTAISFRFNSDPANKIKHFSRGDCALTAPRLRPDWAPTGPHASASRTSQVFMLDSVDSLSPTPPLHLHLNLHLLPSPSSPSP